MTDYDKKTCRAEQLFENLLSARYLDVRMTSSLFGAMWSDNVLWKCTLAEKESDLVRAQIISLKNQPPPHFVGTGLNLDLFL